MATVKCVSREGDSLQTGRRLIPGATAYDVDITHPDVRGRIEAGRLLVLDDDLDVPSAKVDDILSWVGDDPERAAAALAAERTRPERDQRSTLVDKLAELVDATDDTSEED